MGAVVGMPEAYVAVPMQDGSRVMRRVSQSEPAWRLIFGVRFRRNISTIFMTPHQSLRITISIFVLLHRFVGDFRTIMLYTRNTHHHNSKLLKGLRNHLTIAEVPE